MIASESVTNVVLLVEDDTSLREQLADNLLREGFYVLEASDVPKALDILRTYDGLIEWLVTDVRLGEMSGLHVAFEFRFLHPTRAVVFITGYEPADELSRIEKAVVLRKPFSARRLIDIMIDLRETSTGQPFSL